MEARHSDNLSSKEHVLELLSPFVDGETSVDETRHVERHVAVCSLCAGQLAFLRATARTLRQASPVYPSPDLFARIARATYEKPTFSQRLAAYLRPAPVRVALGGVLAAGIVAAVVVPGRLNVVPTTSQNGGDLAAVAPASPTPHTATDLPATPSLPGAHFTLPGVGTVKSGSPSLASIPKVVKKARTSLASPRPLAKNAAANTTARETNTANVRPSLLAHNGAGKTPASPLLRPTPPLPVITAAQLHISRKPVQLAMNSSVAARLRNDLSFRGALPTRLARPDTKIEVASSAVATVAPIAIRPEAKTAELALNPTPKSNGAAGETVTAAATPAPRFSRFNLGGSGTNNRGGNGLILASYDRNAAPAIQDGHVRIVQAPLGNGGSDGK